MDSMERLIGQRLGPYQIVALLGRGNMSTVYRATRSGMPRDVALKVLPQHMADEPVAVRRFRQEADILSSLKHPNILPMLDFGEAGSYVYMAMPLVEHGTLAGSLQGRLLSLDEIVASIWELADALQHAHAAGIVHRDVKPSNVLLDRYRHCILTDFGIAKLVSSATRLTGTGLAVGTPTYMSPEQALDRDVGPSSDLYSLGVILYQMATGRVPFRAGSAAATVMLHINATVPPPRSLNPNLTPEVESVIVRALAKTPADRYASATAMADALQEATLGRG